LSKPSIKSVKTEMEQILSFIEQSDGLKAQISDDGLIQVTQVIDSKIFTFSVHSVVEILERKDSENKDFLQLNFKNSTKVLLTENLVGFKPSQTLGLDMNKLPKVVTTPDLLSVYDALEEAMGADTTEHEVEMLKKVYLAIIDGGERVGFRLEHEKKWLHRLLGSRFAASA
jgi:hypothetical protein